MKKIKNTTTQQASIVTAVTGPSTSSNQPSVTAVKPPRVCGPPHDWIKDTFFNKGRQYIQESKKFGKTRTCRVCNDQLKRVDKYLNLDIYQIVRSPRIEFTVCMPCVDNWSKQLHKLNDDMQRDSSSGC